MPWAVEEQGSHEEGLKNKEKGFQWMIVAVTSNTVNVASVDRQKLQIQEHRAAVSVKQVVQV